MLRAIAIGELHKCLSKGPKDEYWLFGCWCAFESGEPEWREFAEDYKRLVLKAVAEGKQLGLFLSLARRKPKPKKWKLRAQLLRALIKLAEICDPTWSQVRVWVATDLEILPHHDTWTRERKLIPFSELPE